MIAAVLLTAGLLGQVGGTFAAFTGRTTTTASFTARTDFRPPSVDRSVVQKAEGYTPGYVRAGGSYRVYANVVDATGVGAVTSDTTSLTAGAAATALTASAATVGGLTYTHQSSAALAVAAGTAAGTKAFTVTTTDTATPPNTSTPLAASVTVDNTAPAASALTLVNGGTGPVRQLNAGDVITFTWNDVVEPQTVLSVPVDWSGTATTTNVAVVNNLGGGNDALVVGSSNIGTVDLGSAGYVGGTVTFASSATTWTTGTTSVLRIALGTAVGGTTSQVAATPATQVRWTPSSAVIDRAGNPTATTPLTVAGPGF